jgi:rhamnosyltransferase
LSSTGIIKNELLLTNPFNLPISSHEEISDFLKVREFSSKDDSKAEKKLHLNLKEDVSVKYGLVKKSPIVVHFHVYYIDILDEFIKYLIRIPLPIDIFITTPFEDFIEPIIDRLAPIAQFVKVRVVANKGRDVAPFLTTLVENNFKDYDLGLKLHTKKSLYSDRGAFWRRRILQGLLPDSIKIQQIFDLVQEDGAGIIGGSSEYLAGDSYWGSNSESYFHISNLVDFDQGIASSLEFFAGSMFWFNPRIFHQHEVLKSILDTFESESGFQDGTQAHAFERLFCKFARDKNLGIFGVDDLSQDISTLDLKNTIPVINS